MSLISYIKNLLPSFKKDRVLEDSRMVKTELTSVSIPSYKEAEKLLVKWDFKSKQVQGFITIFNRNMKGSSAFGVKDNMIVSIRKGLEKLLETHEVIEERLNKTLEDDVVAEGITCLKANLIQCLEAISFVSKYSYKFLNYVYIAETGLLEGSSDRSLKDNYAPSEIELIEKDFTKFCLALAALTKSKPELEKLIDKIPDVIVSVTNSDALASTLGNDKLNPIGLHGFDIPDPSSISMNPIYHIGLMVAEFQANQYKVSKETKKILELRLLNLELTMQKNPDAKLQKEIEYIQSRIQGLDYKIRKMEESIK